MDYMKLTDYKQLCAELYSIFEKYDDESNLGGIYRDMEADGIDILDRARAALAEPEPEGPTDKEIIELMPQQMRGDLAAAARALAGFVDPDNIKAASVFRIILNRHSADHARAVLARWGNNTSRSN